MKEASTGEGPAHDVTVAGSIVDGSSGESYAGEDRGNGNGKTSAEEGASI